MKIFLDDLYETQRASQIPAGYIGVKNFDEFKELLEDTLQKGEKIEGISFDNDLGEGEKEGWEIAKWLTDVHPEIFEGQPELFIHSANPSGRERIDNYLKRGQEHFRELIEAKNLPDPWGEMK